jgi:hypothetical protein
MQINKDIVTTGLGIVFTIALIVLSYVNGSIFLDQILMCSFIIAVALFARLRSGVKKVSVEKEQNNH